MLNLLSLEESQTVDSLEKGIHDQRLCAAEVVELHCQILDELLHLDGLGILVLLLAHHVHDETPGILDVVDGKVLSLSEFHDSLLVDTPLLTSDQDEDNEHDGAENEESRQHAGQDEEVLVNED